MQDVDEKIKEFLGNLSGLDAGARARISAMREKNFPKRTVLVCSIVCYHMAYLHRKKTHTFLSLRFIHWQTIAMQKTLGRL